MLVKEVAAEFNGRVKVNVEEYGSSPMAQRFGVRRYPVVFVDAVLLARPKDFGFGGPEDVSGGRYVPWREPANQRRFKEDLRAAVARHLAGGRAAGLDIADVTKPDTSRGDGPATFPPLAMKTVAGRTLDAGFGQGRALVVEMWATWCPPCRSTLDWLDTLQRNRASDVRVVAIAVDSDPQDVGAMVSKRAPSYDVVMGTPDIINAFGAVAAVPKLLVFDRSGTLTRVLYGAPADLHAQIEAAVNAALAAR